MSPALISLIIALAQQAPSAIAAVSQLIADKGRDPTPEELEALAQTWAADLAAADKAIARAKADEQAAAAPAAKPAEG